MMLAFTENQIINESARKYLDKNPVILESRFFCEIQKNLRS